MSHPNQPISLPKLESDRRYVSLRLKAAYVRGFVSELIETLDCMLRSAGKVDCREYGCRSERSAEAPTHEVAR